MVLFFNMKRRAVLLAAKQLKKPFFNRKFSLILVPKEIFVLFVELPKYSILKRITYLWLCVYSF